MNFDEVMNLVVRDRTQLPFSEKGESAQRKIRSKIRTVVSDAFTQYAMHDKQDIQCMLDYIKKDYGELDDVVNIQKAVLTQLKGLPLADKNNLIRLLTHNENGLNNDILTLLPDLRKRSNMLLEKTTRATRADQIPLQFINEFMHDYCRYVILMQWMKVLNYQTYHFIFHVIFIESTPLDRKSKWDWIVLVMLFITPYMNTMIH